MKITSDKRFQENQRWGEPRNGHPEGTLGQHVQQLFSNFNLLLQRFPILPRILTPEGILKIQILISVHDSMKPQAKAGVPVGHRANHATLAAGFLRRLGAPNDLVLMTELHDESHALYRQSQRTDVDEGRVSRLLGCIPSWDIFLTFQICDKVGPGRDLESIRWLVRTLKERQVDFLVPAEEMIDALSESLSSSPAQASTQANKREGRRRKEQ